MGYKRFSPNDLVHNTIVTHPESEFLVHNGKVYYQKERSTDTDNRTDVCFTFRAVDTQHTTLSVLAPTLVYISHYTDHRVQLHTSNILYLHTDYCTVYADHA